MTKIAVLNSVPPRLTMPAQTLKLGQSPVDLKMFFIGLLSEEQTRVHASLAMRLGRFLSKLPNTAARRQDKTERYLQLILPIRESPDL